MWTNFPEWQMKNIEANNGELVIKEEDLPEDMKKNVAVHREGKDARGRTKDERRQRKFHKPHRIYGDKEAGDAEAVQAQTFLDTSDYDQAIFHYRLATLQDPYCLEHRIALLRTLRKMPNRNFTQEVLDGQEALNIARDRGHKDHNVKNHQTIVTIVFTTAMELIRAQNKSLTEAQLRTMRMAATTLGKGTEEVKNFKKQWTYFSNAAKRAAALEKGIPYDSEDEGDEDEIEVGRQLIEGEFAEEVEKLKLYKRKDRRSTLGGLAGGIPMPIITNV